MLHVGDHDPSGVHLFKALTEDVTAMMRDRGGRPDLPALPSRPQIAELTCQPPRRRRATGDHSRRDGAGRGDPAGRPGRDRDPRDKTRQDAKIRAGLLAREQAVQDELVRWIEGAP